MTEAPINIYTAFIGGPRKAWLIQPGNADIGNHTNLYKQPVKEAQS